MAETNGLLNRRTGKSGTEGSNPSVSATLAGKPTRHMRRPGMRLGPFGARPLHSNVRLALCVAMQTE